MTVDLMKYLINKYDGTPNGQNYPCSNQMVGNYIWVSAIDDYIEKCLKYLNAKIIKRTKYNLIVEINNIEYTVLLVTEDTARGRRTHRGFIDGRLSDEIVQTYILPGMSLYCKEVKIF